MSQNYTVSAISSYKDITHTFGNFDIIFSEPIWETPDAVSLRRFEAYTELPSMHAAGEHLSNGLSVREISELFRFSEITSFCRMFKKYYGITPSEFQRRALNKQN